MNKTELQKFEDRVRHHLNDARWAKTYLKAGLPADLNLGGTLTPEIFSALFLVERPKDEKLNELIKDLFDDDSHNLLCIESDRGSGKSTFVQTLHMQYDPDHTYDYPFPCIDFSKRQRPKTILAEEHVDIDDSDRYHENLIFQRFRKRYRQACQNPEWISKFYSLLNSLVENFVTYPQSDGYIDFLREAYLFSSPE